MRQERGRPSIVELEAWLCEQRAKLSKNSDRNKPINYCLSRWNAAIRFLDEGALVCRTTLPKASYASMRAAGARLDRPGSADEAKKRARHFHVAILNVRRNISRFINDQRFFSWFCRPLRCSLTSLRSLGPLISRAKLELSLASMSCTKSR